MINAGAKRSFSFHDFSTAINSDTARSPRIDGLQIVNNQGHLRISGLQILMASRPPRVESADEELCPIKFIGNRHRIRLPVS